jgi:8-oxo-dGTP diphosphatase
VIYSPVRARVNVGREVHFLCKGWVYKNMRRGIVALVFRCHIVSGQPTPTAEASEVSWLTPAQVAELMNEAYATRLLDAL